MISVGVMSNPLLRECCDRCRELDDHRRGVKTMAEGNPDPQPSKPDGGGIEKIIGAGSNPKNK